MKAKLISERHERTFVLIFETGDEVRTGLLEFSREHEIAASHLTAIGALQSATLGYWDWERKDYRKLHFDEQVEVLSLIGDITMAGDEFNVHAHVVIGKSDGTAHGGHLLEAIVRPTLEVILSESPTYLRRRTDRATGLALIDFKEE